MSCCQVLSHNVFGYYTNAFFYRIRFINPLAKSSWHSTTFCSSKRAANAFIMDPSLSLTPTFLRPIRVTQFQASQILPIMRLTFFAGLLALQLIGWITTNNRECAKGLPTLSIIQMWKATSLLTLHQCPSPPNFSWCYSVRS